MPKILIVEDDKETAQAIKALLPSEQFECEVVADGSESLLRLQFLRYDLILLDWQLPSLSGLEVLKRFRGQGGKTPVLMLTGKGQVSDKTKGLDSGADDYLTKPFDGKELLSRVRALLRRPAPYTGSNLTVAHIQLNQESQSVKCNGQEVRLLPKEFAVLQFLMRNTNRVFSPNQLLRAVWTDESDATIAAVTSCMKRLRQKIDVEGQPSIIRTVYGAGYKIEDP